MSDYYVKWKSSSKYHLLRSRVGRSLHIEAGRASSRDRDAHLALAETQCGLEVPYDNEAFTGLPQGIDANHDVCYRCLAPGTPRVPTPDPAQERFRSEAEKVIKKSQKRQADAARALFKKFE